MVEFFRAIKPNTNSKIKDVCGTGNSGLGIEFSRKCHPIENNFVDAFEALQPHHMNKARNEVRDREAISDKGEVEFSSSVCGSFAFKVTFASLYV